MPATEPGAGEGVPPMPPADAPGDADAMAEDEVPWYKKPGPIAIMVVVALAILGLLAWLIWGGDDDEASSTSSLLILETTDETGSEIDVGFIVSVVGPAESPTSFEWLRPDGVPPGEAAGADTGTDGRVDFEWQADESVEEPEAWLSTVSAVVNVPRGLGSLRARHRLRPRSAGGPAELGGHEHRARLAGQLHRSRSEP